MRTSLDCLVCFVGQTRSLGMLTSDDQCIQRRMLDYAGRFIASVDTEQSPPENVVPLYAAFTEILHTDDPFARLKRESNEFALALRERIRKRILAAEDSLRAAVRAAVGGNIIDYGILHSFDAAATMQDCFEREFSVDHYPAFLKALNVAEPKVLYLCDNCGEIVFDGLLIEQLQNRGCRLTAAVRDQPIINDATLEDARASGLDHICPVLRNGTGCPGTPLDRCSRAAQTHIRAADLIISKGMGNFETLSEEPAPIFFLFTVKCTQVARYLSEQQGLAPETLTGSGEMILLRQSL